MCCRPLKACKVLMVVPCLMSLFFFPHLILHPFSWKFASISKYPTVIALFHSLPRGICYLIVLKRVYKIKRNLYLCNFIIFPHIFDIYIYIYIYKILWVCQSNLSYYALPLLSISISCVVLSLSYYCLLHTPHLLPPMFFTCFLGSLPQSRFFLQSLLSFIHSNYEI